MKFPFVSFYSILFLFSLALSSFFSPPSFPPNFPISFLQVTQPVVYSTTFLYYTYCFYHSAIPDYSSIHHISTSSFPRHHLPYPHLLFQLHDL
jgi:hypothetical protein